MIDEEGQKFIKESYKKGLTPEDISDEIWLKGVDLHINKIYEVLGLTPPEKSKKPALIFKRVPAPHGKPETYKKPITVFSKKDLDKNSKDILKIANKIEISKVKYNLRIQILRLMKKRVEIKNSLRGQNATFFN